MNIKQIILVIIAVAVIGIGGTIWFKYKKLSNDNATLRQNQIVLESANEVNTNTINTLQADAIRNEANRNELQEKLDASSKKSNDLSRLLARHNLEYLAEAKPKLIENRINRATKALFDELEGMTK